MRHLSYLLTLPAGAPDTNTPPVLVDIEHGYQESTDSPIPFFHLLERLKRP